MPDLLLYFYRALALQGLLEVTGNLMNFLIDFVKNFAFYFFVFPLVFIEPHKDVPLKLQDQFFCLVEGYL